MARTKKSVKRFKTKLRGQSVKDYKKSSSSRGPAPHKKREVAPVEEVDDSLQVERPTLDDASVEDLLSGEFFNDLADVEDDEEEEEEAPKKKKKEKAANGEGEAKEDGEEDEDDDDDDDSDDAEEHEMDIKNLAEVDPDFYEFLLKNDKSLLNFSAADAKKQKQASADDDEEEDDEADEDGMDDDEDAELEGEEEEEEGEEGEKKKKYMKKAKVVLTSEVLRSWATQAAKGSLKAIRRLVVAFRAACKSDTVHDKSSRLPFSIRDRRVFNQLLLFCLRNMHRLFDRTLEYQSTEATNTLPSSSPRWGQISIMVKNFLQSLMHFLRTATQSDMAAALLQSAFALVPYIGAVKDYSTRFLKVLLDMWTQGQDDVRVQSFLVIHRMAQRLPYPFINHCLKSSYLAFVRNSKFVHQGSKTHIEFMSNCVVELYALDPKAAYLHAFVYVRQLALHLRNALTNKTKESHRAVYNWQYINSLALWTKVVTGGATGRPPASELLHLVYPVVQLIVGAVGLVPTPRYYPLRFHCIRLLLRIAEANHTFINVFPYILQVLDVSAFKKAKAGSAKPLDFSHILKAGPSHVNTKPYMKQIFEESMALLRGGLAVYSHSVAFPELVVPTLSHVKRFRREIADPAMSKELLTFIQKTEHNANFVRGLRSGFDVSGAGGLAQVPAEVALDKQAPFAQYHAQLAAQRKRSASALRDQSGGDASDDDEGDLFEPNNRKKRKIAPAQQQQQAKKNTKQDNKKKQKQQDDEEEDDSDSYAGGDNDEDLVEDFVLSD